MNSNNSREVFLNKVYHSSDDDQDYLNEVKLSEKM